MSESSCCGAEVIYTDICSVCGEHCDIVHSDFFDENDQGDWLYHSRKDDELGGNP